MNNYQKSGDVITLTAPSGGVVSGGVYKIEQLVVVAQADVAVGLPFEGVRIGQFSGLAKETGVEWVEGSPLFWDDGNSRFTPTSASGLVLCATAAEAAASGDATGTVLLGVISNADVS